VLIKETLRAAGGRTIGVRGLDDDGLERTGRVLERESEELGGVDRVDLSCCSPARCKSAEWPPRWDGPFGVVLIEERLSELGDSSQSWRSGGGGVLRRSSSDGKEIWGKWDDGTCEDIVSVWGEPAERAVT
jgi:hypothetical protein